MVLWRRLDDWYIRFLCCTFHKLPSFTVTWCIGIDQNILRVTGSASEKVEDDHSVAAMSDDHSRNAARPKIRHVYVYQNLVSAISQVLISAIAQVGFCDFSSFGFCDFSSFGGLCDFLSFGYCDSRL